ncbi:MAG: hypothetical protein KDK89_15310 [Alphaproteobacteria bacterium]|nr:hypothetical protein [Alphaproteobacteria bacterium]
MADIDATLLQRVFGVAQSERELDVHFRSEPDDLRAGLERLERAGSCPGWMLSSRPDDSEVPLTEPLNTTTTGETETKFLTNSGDSPSAEWNSFTISSICAIFGCAFGGKTRYEGVDFRGGVDCRHDKRGSSRNANL